MKRVDVTWREAEEPDHTFGVSFNGSQLWWWKQEDETQFEPPGAQEDLAVQTVADFLRRGPAHVIDEAQRPAVERAVQAAAAQPPEVFVPLSWHDAATVRAALDAGADPLVFDAHGHQALHRLALDGAEVALVREVLGAGASPLHATRGGWTALHAAALRGRVALVKLFVTATDVPAEDLDRALGGAIESGTDAAAQEETALALLDAGAAPGMPHLAHETALTLAAHAGMPRLLRELIDGGHADLTGTNRYGQGVVLMAVPTYGRPERARALQLLIDAGADVEARTESGYRPLDEAARMGCVESARMLLAAGAERTARAYASGQRHDNPELDDLLRPPGGA